MINQKELKEDMQKLTLEEVLQKYNMSLMELFKYQKQIYPNQHLKYGKEVKYITKKKKGYAIYKRINNETTYFGTYGSESEAERIVEELVKIGWIPSELPRILEELNIKTRIGE